MIARTRRRRYSTLARRRAGGIIVFAAIMIPTALFALALTSDYGRVILATRQTADVADALAMAAASARSDDGDQLDVTVARQRAVDTYAKALAMSMVAPAVTTRFGAGDVTFSPDMRTVTVKVRWEVKTLPLVRLFTRKIDGIAGSATRSARVCIADADARPCAYPV